MFTSVKYPFAILMLLTISIGVVYGQERKAFDRCGTMQVLEENFKRHPGLRKTFENNAARLQSRLQQGAGNLRITATSTIINIPIVFHIVLQNPNIITDAQVQAQVDVLNRDFTGLNADSTKIPPAFKPLFAHGGIQFTLAQRTPEDEPSNGIERITTSRSSFSRSDTRVKYTAEGGADAWDPSRFLNVWVCVLSNGDLGYATFPGGSIPAEEGIVVLYSSLPGGSAPYNLGRTLTHEMGHYFFLYHIWGDDGNACTGSDLIGDTPNQAGSTFGCPGTTIVTDACSPTAPGIMYENYMDYTDDACMVMFTLQQEARMESALNTFRTTLFSSNGATPVILKTLDASLRSINNLAVRICSPTFTAGVSLRNRGSQTLTSADLFASVDGATPVLTHWTGSLPSLATVNVALPPLTTVAGTHTLKVWVANPNGGADMETANDTLSYTFFYAPPPALPLVESFEGSTFPPPGWDIVNPDNGFTWERTTQAAKTGTASVVMRNFEYQENDLVDYLRLPLVNITNADSAFMTFQVAAAVQTDPATTGNVWDTLQVLVSTDCGATYTSIYKKWGSNLITRKTAETGIFVPTPAEWRKDSVNLTGYIGAGPVLIAFANTTEFENNIYLDDVNVYKVTVNPNLKAQGLLVTPNPTDGMIAVQFYPNPILRNINIYNATGQRVISRTFADNTTAGTYYSFDLRPFASGVYIVQVVYSNKTVTRKVIKR